MEEVYFAFEKTSAQGKKEKIKKIFDDSSEKYDLMNDLMSFSTHHIWKKIMVNELLLRDNSHLLDMACGTCDIGINYYKKALRNSKNVKITACDINEKMLAMGEKRLIKLHAELSKNKRINCDLNYFRENIFTTCLADAEKLQFDDNIFDRYALSFGLRNMSLRNDVFSEAYRVLKKTGKIVIMEFTMPNIMLLNKIYKLYLDNFIPFLGENFAKDKADYEYLAKSIMAFPRPETIIQEMKENGFVNCNSFNLGSGIVTTFTGYKL